MCSIAFRSLSVLVMIPFTPSHSITHSFSRCGVLRRVAHVKVLGVLLGDNYLHGEIREKGGAYGAGLCSSDVQM
jgi:Zn-dependent M16 (insulinase) family peptidase